MFSAVKFRIKYLMLTTDDGEDVWGTMIGGLSYHDAQTHRRWLSRGDDPLTVRVEEDS